MVDQKTTDRFSTFQFARNIGANIVVFVVNTLISFWFTPFLINSLGHESYGFIPLITGVVSYFTLITNSLNSGTSRFLMIEIEQGNDEQANVIFNTTFISILVLLTLSVPLGLLLFAHVDVLFLVPSDYLTAVRALLVCSMIALLFNALRTTFSIASYTQNRFDLRGFFGFLGRTAQVGAVTALFLWRGPSLYFAGIGLAVAAAFTLLGDVFLWRRLLPQLKLRLRYFKANAIRDIAATSGWILIATFGALIQLNVEIILANRFLPLAVAGIYGGLLAVPSNLRGIAYTVNSVWGPLLLSKYSRADLTGIARVSRSSVKLIGLSIALPIGFVAGTAKQFLGLWLGPEFETFALVGTVMAIHLGLNFSTEPLNSLFTSMNRLRLPAAVSVLSGIVTVALGIALTPALGALGLAIAAAAGMTLRNGVFFPLFAARILNKPWWYFISMSYLNLLLTMLVAALSYLAISQIENITWASFIAVGALISAAYVIPAFSLGLSKTEKEQLLRRQLG